MTTEPTTLEALLSRIRVLLEARTVECPDKGEDVGWKDGVHTEFGYRPFQDIPHLACNGTGSIADPRYAPLLALVREECFHLSFKVTDNWDFNDDDWEDAVREDEPISCNCRGSGYMTRTDWREGKDEGALYGAFSKATERDMDLWGAYMTAKMERSHNILSNRAAAEAMLAALEAMP